MQIVFRRFGDGAPASHELWVRPVDPVNRDRRDIAALACAEGPTAFERGSGELTTIVVQQDPTLDDMLASAILERQLAGEQLGESLATVCRYAALSREGLRPGRVPIEDSLEGIHAAFRNLAGSDLTDPANGGKFARDWKDLAEAIFSGVEKGVDPFDKSLIAGDPRFARPRAFLQDDHKVYRQDVARSERLLVEIPGGPGKAAGLILEQPKSLLWKYWARCDDESPVGKAYLFTAIDWGNGQWVFSTDPVHRQSIKSLADELNAAEAQAPGNTSATDPWFDGKPFGHTLVAAPHSGTKLPAAEVRKLVKKWCRARRPPPPPSPHGRTNLVLAGVTVAAVAALIVVSLRTPAAVDVIPPAPRVTVDDHTFRTIGQDRSRLFIIGIGISTYADPKLHLKYADADARELSQVLQEESAGIFDGESNVQLIIRNEDAAPEVAGPTREDILAALLKLESSDPEKAPTRNDLVVITISAHGMTDRDGDYYLLTSTHAPGMDPRVTGLSWNSDIAKTLRRLDCTTIVILDTCESGGAIHAGARGAGDPDEFADVMESAVEAFRSNEKGVIVLPACLKKEKAHEEESWKHGALTLSVLEALQGKVRRTDNRSSDEQAEAWLPQPEGGVVPFADVIWYAQKRVQSLTTHLTDDAQGQYVKTWQSNPQVIDRWIPLANRNRSGRDSKSGDQTAASMDRTDAPSAGPVASAAVSD